MKLAFLKMMYADGVVDHVFVVGDNTTEQDKDRIILESKIRYNPKSDMVVFKLQSLHDFPVLNFGWGDGSGISEGVWRQSFEGDEVTTSRKGVLEGSKRIADVRNGLKPEKEVMANGKAIAAIPLMRRALMDADAHFNSGASADVASNSVRLALCEAFS